MTSKSQLAETRAALKEADASEFAGDADVAALARKLAPHRVNGKTIEILRVFHTSRRPPNRW